MQSLRTISAPFDVGASMPGANHGPQAFLDFGLIPKLVSSNISIAEGPTCFLQEENAPAAMRAFKNGRAVYGAVESVYDATLEVLDQGHIPLTLGGDHSLAIGSIGAAALHAHRHDKPLKVLWIDAHADFNTQDTSPTGNIHGMPVAVLTQAGPPPLQNLIGPHGFVLPQHIFQLGIRSVDGREQERLAASAIQVLTPKDVRTLGVAGVTQRVIDFVAPTDHFHISFDVDGLDPQYAPGVGTTEPDGLALQDMAQLFLALHAHKRPTSMDIYEYNPTLDHEHTTAKSILHLLKALWAGETT